MGIRLDSCLHESAHSIARQVLLGNLGEMGLKKRRAYSYPVNRRPLDEMTSEELAKIAVIVQQIAGFSNEQMQGFAQEAAELVQSYETAIRKTATELNRRNRLNGEQVTRLLEKYPPQQHS